MRETLWFDAWHANAMIYQSSSNSSKIPSLKSLYSMFVIRAPQIPTMLGLLESERDIKNAKKARFSSCKKREQQQRRMFQNVSRFSCENVMTLANCQLSVLLAALCFVFFPTILPLSLMDVMKSDSSHEIISTSLAHNILSIGTTDSLDDVAGACD